MAYNSGGLTQGFAQGLGLAQQYQQNEQRQQDRAEDRAFRHEQMDFQREARQEQREWRKEDRQREQDGIYAKSMFSRIQAGQELNEDDYEFLERRPEFDPGFLSSDEMTSAIEKGKQVLDPNDPADANDPESLAALNTMFAPRIGKGKRIAGVYPGQTPGTVAFDLEVDGEDGQKYNAPMTSKRGKEGDDDDVLEVKVNDLVDHFQGYAQLNQALRHQDMTKQVQAATANITNRRQQRQPMSDQQRTQALQFGRNMDLIKKPETTYQTINGPDGAILQQGSDGSLRSVLGRRPRDPASVMRTPTSIQEVQYLMTNMGLSKEEATNRVFSQRNSGELTGRDIAKMEYDQINSDMKALNARLENFPTDEEKEQIAAQKQQLENRRRQIIEEARGGGQRTSALPSRQQGGNSGGQQRSGGAPAQAVQYLQQNDSPQMRQQFKQKYGYLPEGM